MLIAIVGGKLQGVEALYLAKKAGYSCLLIDKNPNATAVNLCDHFLQHEFSLQTPIPPDCPPVDLILPAIENDEVLNALPIWAQTESIPLAFDPTAYAISSSKQLSDKFFRELNLPTPRPWPDCGFPVIVKPDSDSGSRRVQICDDWESLNSYLSAHRDDRIVIQEMITGPSYSLEVIGMPDSYHLPQITELHMDHMHDCCRVTAPVALAAKHSEALHKSSLMIAEQLQLRGIMDVEVILHEGTCKILEIDARLPSQTPMAVYWSTGCNMVELLCNSTLGIRTQPETQSRRYASVEHIHFQQKSIEVLGEHIMSSDGPLTLYTDFFGADEALSSYRHGKQSWVATLIFTGNSAEEIASRRTKCFERISKGGPL